MSKKHGPDLRPKETVEHAEAVAERETETTAMKIDPPEDQLATAHPDKAKVVDKSDDPTQVANLDAEKAAKLEAEHAAKIDEAHANGWAAVILPTGHLRVDR